VKSNWSQRKRRTKKRRKKKPLFRVTKEEIRIKVAQGNKAPLPLEGDGDEDDRNESDGEEHGQKQGRRDPQWMIPM
jgi:hypothetical protein